MREMKLKDAYYWGLTVGVFGTSMLHDLIDPEIPWYCALIALCVVTLVWISVGQKFGKIDVLREVIKNVLG